MLYKFFISLEKLFIGFFFLMDAILNGIVFFFFARLIFVFLLETKFLHVGQVDLELPTSGDLPASIPQSAGITGVSHCTRPHFVSFN